MTSSPSIRPTVEAERLSSAITSRPLSVRRVIARIGDNASGAVVVFVGKVRPDRTRAGRVTALDYESDRPVALRQLARLERMAERRFRVRRVRIEHRIGRLPVGTASVIVGVAAPHRAAALAATKFLIERLKREVPIWKTDRRDPERSGRRRRTRPRPRAGR